VRSAPGISGCSPVTRSCGRSAINSSSGCAANQTSSLRAGLPTGWTSADKTGSGDYGSTNDVGVAYGPDGERVLLSIMTRSQTDDPKAENLRPLIGELTTLVLPYLRGLY
jgi:beta-lactamase class A